MSTQTLTWRTKKVNSWTTLYSSVDSHLDIRESDVDGFTKFEVMHNNQVLMPFDHFQSAEKYIIEQSKKGR